MRHGQAISNVRGVCSSWPEKFYNPITDLGRQTVKESAEKLKKICVEQGKSIDLIFASPLLRCQQTVEIVGDILGVKPETEERLKEIEFGEFNGKDQKEMWASFKDEQDRIARAVDGGETYKQILERMTAIVKDLEKKYKDKNIMLVSHECPSFLLQGWFNGFSIKETIEKSPTGERIHKGEIRELN